MKFVGQRHKSSSTNYLNNVSHIIIANQVKQLVSLELLFKLLEKYYTAAASIPGAN
jgi:hypothetical protein